MTGPTSEPAAPTAGTTTAAADSRAPPSAAGDTPTRPPGRARPTGRAPRSHHLEHGGRSLGTDRADGHTDRSLHAAAEPGYRAAAEQFDTEAFEARLKYQLPPARRTAVFLAQAQQAVQDAITRHGHADPAAMSNLHDEIDNATRHLTHPPTPHPRRRPACGPPPRSRAEPSWPPCSTPTTAPTARAESLDSWNAHITERTTEPTPRRRDASKPTRGEPRPRRRATPARPRRAVVDPGPGHARVDAASRPPAPKRRRAAGTAPPARAGRPGRDRRPGGAAACPPGRHYLAAHTDPDHSATARREQLNRWHDDDRTADR